MKIRNGNIANSHEYARADAHVKTASSPIWNQTRLKNVSVPIDRSTCGTSRMRAMRGIVNDATLLLQGAHCACVPRAQVYNGGMAPRFVCAHIRAMDGHTPDEQQAASASSPGERVIKLNTNENPFPPSPKVMQAIRDIEPEVLRRYPDASADLF